MIFRSYGLILHIKQFNEKYNLVGILTDYGYWKGLHLINRGYLSIFSQAYCVWEGKNADSIGYWELTKIMHLPYKPLMFFHSESERAFLTYCVSLYISNLAISLFPERVPCKQNLETLLIVKELLANNKWLHAWMIFEEFISDIKILDNMDLDSMDIEKSIDFFTTTADYVKNIYQYDINNHLRKVLIKALKSKDHKI